MSSPQREKSMRGWPRRHAKFFWALLSFFGLGGLLLIANFLFPERLVVPSVTEFRAELIDALNPGVFPLKGEPKEYIEQDLVPRLKVKWSISLEKERKTGTLDLRYPHLFVNSNLFVSKLRDVLAEELTTERKFFAFSYLVDCLRVEVNRRVIPFGAEGFRIPEHLFCVPPRRNEVITQACSLAGLEAVRMQDILTELGYYGGPIYENIDLDVQRPDCGYEWEQHQQVKESVKAFQHDHGLSPDGDFGRNTRAVLRRALRRETERRGIRP